MARYPYTTCNVALARAALGPPIYSFLQQRSNISSSKNPDSKKEEKTASKRDPGVPPFWCSPARRTERLAFRKTLVRHAQIVVRPRVDGIAPPFLYRVLADRAVLRVLQRKIDKQKSDRITRVQSGGQHI